MYCIVIFIFIKTPFYFKQSFYFYTVSQFLEESDSISEVIYCKTHFSSAISLASVICLSAKLFSKTYHCNKRIQLNEITTLSCLCPGVLISFIILFTVVIIQVPHWLFYSIFLPDGLSNLIYTILLHKILINIMFCVPNKMSDVFVSVHVPPVPSPPPGACISLSAPSLTASPLK